MNKNSKSKKKSETKFKPKLNQYCDACGTRLFIKGGYADTGLCGPCCMGEIELLDEAGLTW